MNVTIFDNEGNKVSLTETVHEVYKDKIIK